MGIFDYLPDAGLLAGALVAVAAVSPAQAADKYAVGECRVARQSIGTYIRPTSAGGSYLFYYHGDDPRYRERLSSGEFFSGGKVALISAPAHGKVIRETGQWSSPTDYHYWPNDGYVGRDRFVMQVEKDGVKVRIHYMIEVVGADDPTTIIGEDGEKKGIYCNPEQWKISSSTANPFLTTTALDSGNLQVKGARFNLTEIVGLPQPDKRTLADLTGLVVRLNG